MNRIVLLTCVVAFAGCSRHEPIKAEAKAEPRKPGEVVLTQAAQQTGGIVVQKIDAQAVSESISSTGQLTVNEDQTWSVGALMDGRIVSVSVKLGDRVAAGQVLASIHSHDVHDARAAYKTAEAELARAQAAEALARRLHDRARRLFDLKAASQQEVDTAGAELRNAQAAVVNAKTALEKERTHIVEFLDVPVEDTGADYVPIKAPAAGIVLERKATPGSVVSAGDPVFRITSPASLWMTANVNEADLAQLRPGQPVRVLVRAFPDRPFPGRILRLGEELDSVTRTLQVRVLVPNPSGVLKPGMFAAAEIDRGGSRPAIFVPEGAVQEVNGARVVFVRTAPDRFETRPVQIARTVNGAMEVSAGLLDGDQIVTKGSFILKSQLLKSSLEEE